MFWYLSGAAVPLEVSWRSGIAAYGLALAALVAGAALVGLVMRARRSMRRRVAPVLTPITGGKEVRRIAA